jgi:hypothetical protein
MILTKTGQQHGIQQVADQKHHYFSCGKKIPDSNIRFGQGNYSQKKFQSFIKANVMNLFFLHLPARHRKPDEHKMVTVYKPPYFTSEGSEFLDDAIRMKEQPLEYTEKSIASMPPENRR